MGRIVLKTYDAAVGDITILRNRLNDVEFTQAYTESGLSMIVPISSLDTALLIMKPFTLKMWIITGVIFIYTMFVVWFLEHQNNSEFGGKLKDQISTSLWFTFSSLFFAHSKYNLTYKILFHD